MGRLPFTSQNTKEVIHDKIILSGSNGSNGISKKDLLQQVFPLDQSTVYRVTKQLAESGLIKITRNGQRTRYLALNNQRQNQTLGTHLLGKEFVNNFPSINEDLILSDYTWQHPFRKGFVLKRPYTIDFGTYRRLYEPRFTNNSRLEKTIFEFSNQIGGFITYLFIQAMNAENIDTLLLLQNKSIKDRAKKDIPQSEGQVRFIIQKWIENSICPITTYMLWNFIRKLKPHGYVPGVTTDEHLKKRKKLGPYLLAKKQTNELQKAFSNLYPRLHYELEKLRDSLPEEIVSFNESYREFARHAGTELKKQKKCEKHEFTKPKMLAERDDHKRRKMIVECNKCGYRYYKTVSYL